MQDAKALAPSVISKQDSSHSTVKNLFKWDYSLLVRGVFMFNYERCLSDNLSIELGLGLIYSNDFIFYTYYVSDHVSKSVTFPDTNLLNYYSSNSRLFANPFANSSINPGVAFDFSQRFYLKKTCFNGFYLSPYISYRKYSYSILGISFNDLYYSFLDIGEKMGYQGHFKRKRSIYFDFYLELAYRRALLNTVEENDETITTYTPPELYGNGTYYTYEQINYSEYLQKLNLFQVMLGAKIGFGRPKK